MSSKTILVRFVSENTLDLVHFVRNFAEEIHSKLKSGSIGSVPEMDSCVDRFRVIIHKKRDCGTAKLLIKKALKHRNHELIAPFFEMDAPS